MLVQMLFTSRDEAGSPPRELLGANCPRIGQTFFTIIEFPVPGQRGGNQTTMLGANARGSRIRGNKHPAVTPKELFGDTGYSTFTISV